MVDRTEYAVYQFNAEYFGICKMSTYGNGACVFGGDSANEDNYNEEYITQVFENWDGKLIFGNLMENGSASQFNYGSSCLNKY